MDFPRFGHIKRGCFFFHSFIHSVRFSRSAIRSGAISIDRNSKQSPSSGNTATQQNRWENSTSATNIFFVIFLLRLRNKQIRHEIYGPPRSCSWIEIGQVTNRFHIFFLFPFALFFIYEFSLCHQFCWPRKSVGTFLFLFLCSQIRRATE